MKVTIVVDNIEHAGIPGEWGFCAYIEQNGKKLLLDTGASNLFAENAEKLNIDLKDIDFAVLSHAHYDHANGMEKFFEINRKATFYLQEGCGENCYLYWNPERDHKEISGQDRICFRGLYGCGWDLFSVTFHTAFRADRKKRDDVPKDKAGMETG